MCRVDVGVRVLQGLKVGVDGDELDARELCLDHAVDRVDAGAADADHAQHGLVGARHDRRERSGVGLVAAEGGADIRPSPPIRRSRPSCSTASALLVHA